MTDFYIDILQKCPVLLGMTENSPEGVFSALFDALVADGCLSADLREVARAAVNAREAIGCTALANGIAIPHGYLEEVQSPIVAVGIHSQGVDCNSIDGEPSLSLIHI